MPWTYRPALDGLRSVAVYLVLLFHAGLGFLDGGFIGVDLFFVLSGFLVSNVILSEIDSTGHLNLGKFYARRIRRLLPAALVVIVATSLVFLLVTPLIRRLPLVGDAQSALLYVANWNFLLKQEDYFAANVSESPFLHFWSLAIEEQFYLFFPVLLLVLVRAARRRPWVLPAALTALFVLSLGSQLVWSVRDQTWAYYGTDARLYQLLAGALLAVALRSMDRRVPTSAANVGALAGLVGMLVLGSSLLDVSPTARGIGATVASVALVGGLMLADTSPLARLLSRHTPVYLGQVSYGTYLWHWPVILVIQQVLEIRPITMAVLAVGISTGLAALSFQVLEAPLRTAKSLHRFRWRTVLVGVSASALVAATVVPTVLDSQRRPRLAAAAATSSGPVTSAVSSQVSVKDRNAPVPKDLDWERLAAPIEDLPTCTVKAPHDCTLVKGSGPHIALVGDSHAMVLAYAFKKLAQEKDFTLSVNVQRGCPWQAGLMDRQVPKSQRESCTSLRDDWYDTVLPGLDPDVVVLASMPRDDDKRWQGRLVSAKGSDEPLAKLLYSTTQETSKRITAQGARVLMLNSLPIQSKNPVECLAAATQVHECEFGLPKAKLSDAYNRTTAALTSGVYVADIADTFCVGEPRCLPIVDGIVVWHDAHHFTTEIAVHEREKIWKRVETSGVLDGL